MNRPSRSKIDEVLRDEVERRLELTFAGDRGASNGQPPAE